MSLTQVGIWLYHVAHLTDIFVWSACLRFLYCERIRHRVTVAPLSFLVLHVAPPTPRPAFAHVPLNTLHVHTHTPVGVGECVRFLLNGKYESYADNYFGQSLFRNLF